VVSDTAEKGLESLIVEALTGHATEEISQADVARESTPSYGGAGYVQRHVKVAAGLGGVAQAGGGAGHVHGHVAAADDQHPLAKVEVVAAEVDVDQKIHRPQNAVELFALDIKTAATVSADGDEDSVESLL